MTSSSSCGSRSTRSSKPLTTCAARSSGRRAASAPFFAKWKGERAYAARTAFNVGLLYLDDEHHPAKVYGAHQISPLDLTEDAEIDAMKVSRELSSRTPSKKLCVTGRCQPPSDS